MKKIKEGDILAEWMKINRYTPVSLAKHIGVSNQAIHYQLKQEYISDSFKHKLVSSGLNVFDMSSNENDYKIKYMQALEQIVELQKDNRDLVKKLDQQKAGK